MIKSMLFLFISLLGSVAMASEKSVYDFAWLDKDKEIYVLQNRKFRKDGKLYIGATGVKTLNGAFIDSYGVNMRAGYFIREDWGIEFAYGKNSGKENNTAKGVKEQGTRPFYRKIDTYMGAMAMWSPFYSKINTFNKIFYYDWLFGAGLASISTIDNSKSFEVPPGGMTQENVMGAIWTTGFRFYINETWSVRIDATALHFKADRTRKPATSASTIKSSTLVSNYDLGVGLNFSF